jgi:hypothetical protein
LRNFRGFGPPTAAKSVRRRGNEQIPSLECEEVQVSELPAGTGDMGRKPEE